MKSLTLLAGLLASLSSFISGLRTQKKVHHGMTHSMASHAAGLSNYSAALAYLDNQPDDGGCMPVCTWKCDTPSCAQLCEPKCDAPRCESRCSMDASSCTFNCQEPSCALVCPETPCVAGQAPCPKCQAVCGEPVCTLDCPGHQPCSTVCEEPTCSYECRKPDTCPEPKCTLVCDKPAGCQDFQVTKQLPPPRPGETTVASFGTSTEILQAGEAPKLHDIPACPPGCTGGAAAGAAPPPTATGAAMTETIAGASTGAATQTETLTYTTAPQVKVIAGLQIRNATGLPSASHMATAQSHCPPGCIR
eukprot:gnl/MRDRNA2_/MRDRNA2_106911_c0_seq1.p1 gnl/MRDRNA2_/MRDRNA2_106911_c0~~gnl/MRDRNA2_/MRDRNA2_106911_c0_seq1.p1  ORF type:complete len:305 (+),score=45.75 gnl/MRDRNA2_/MRDRNA2_106911_c0_seq1:72-986(+)